MNTTLSHWMTAFFVIIAVFTPILAYADSLSRAAVETVLHQATKKASIEGHFSPEILQEVEDTLVDKYKFDRGKIEIVGTSEIKSRKEYLEVTITFPRTPIFVLDLFNQGPSEFTRTYKIMSEFIN